MRIKSYDPRVVTTENDVPPLLFIAWWGEPAIQISGPVDPKMDPKGGLSAELRIEGATLQQVLVQAASIIREHAWWPDYGDFKFFEIYALHPKFIEALPWDHPDQRYMVGLRVWDSRTVDAPITSQDQASPQL